MKVAFHFDESSDNYEHPVLFEVAKRLFPEVIKLPRPEISTKVFVGSLLLSHCAYETKKRDKNSTLQVFNKDKFRQIVLAWANPPDWLWQTITQATVDVAATGNIYVICLDLITLEQAAILDEYLTGFEAYLGAVEVDDTYGAHLAAYSHGLVAFGRFNGAKFHLFWDGFSEDSQDEGMIEYLRELPFKSVEFESLEGRYSIFDTQHKPENTIRAAEAKSFCEGLLASVAERVITILSDPAPELPGKVYSALKSYVTAETSEDLSHVALSCRRTIEYVSDQLFPPQKASKSSSRLDKTAYRNRLLAYADISRRSNISIDLVVASTASLSEQWERLDKAVNKGVHAEVIDSEVRRCIIRTLLLLDDLISLKADPFEQKPKLSFEGLLPDQK